MAEDEVALRREYAESIRHRSTNPLLREARVEHLEDVLERLQASGEISLRRHDGIVIMSWERKHG